MIHHIGDVLAKLTGARLRPDGLRQSFGRAATDRRAGHLLGAPGRAEKAGSGRLVECGRFPNFKSRLFTLYGKRNCFQLRGYLILIVPVRWDQ